MNTITINELAGYLPHDLEMQIKNAPLKGEIHKLSAIYKHGVVCLGDGGKFGFIERQFSEVVPLLWPLDFLTKEIPFEGKMIVPIVELAKNSLTGIENTYAKSIILKNEGVSWMILDNQYWFRFLKSDGSFVFSLNGNPRTINNQLAIFEKMNQLHIDYRNLIPRGLALSKENFKL